MHLSLIFSVMRRVLGNITLILLHSATGQHRHLYKLLKTIASVLTTIPLQLSNLDIYFAPLATLFDVMIILKHVSHPNSTITEALQARPRPGFLFPEDVEYFDWFHALHFMAFALQPVCFSQVSLLWGGMGSVLIGLPSIAKKTASFMNCSYRNGLFGSKIMV